MAPRDPNAPVPTEHVAALLATATAPCDRALIALVAYAGLRPVEACALRVEDVTHGTARLGSSAGTPLRRVAPLPPAVTEAATLAAGDRLEGPLLVTRSGTPLDPRKAVARVKALARAAGLDGKDGRADAPTLPQLRAHALAQLGRPNPSA